jgi:hypothetical protein
MALKRYWSSAYITAIIVKNIKIFLLTYCLEYYKATKRLFYKSTSKHILLKYLPDCIIRIAITIAPFISKHTLLTFYSFPYRYILP